MNRQTGFTLIELMTAVSIAAVLMIVAFPSYQDLVKNNCMTTGANSLVSSFQQARSTAVTRSTNVTISAGSPGNASNEWGGGWSVTLDEDRNGNGTLDAGEDFDGDGVLEATVPLRNVALTCQQTTIDEVADETAFVYGPDGFINIRGTFDICDDRTSETGRQVNLSFTGRPNTDSEYTCL